MDSFGLNLVKNPCNLPWSTFVGAIGIPGMTGNSTSSGDLQVELTRFIAFCGLEGLADVKPGEKIYVSAAAGSTVSLNSPRFEEVY